MRKAFIKHSEMLSVLQDMKAWHRNWAWALYLRVHVPRLKKYRQLTLTTGKCKGKCRHCHVHGLTEPSSDIEDSHDDICCTAVDKEVGKDQIDKRLRADTWQSWELWPALAISKEPAFPLPVCYSEQRSISNIPQITSSRHWPCN